jgi:1-acyl-sn-glycerol-3-phosphate acyltransferase
LRHEFNEVSDEALLALKARLTADDGWTYYAPDPVSRRIHHVLADHFLTHDSEVHGAEHFDRIAGRPVVIFANHLSYADANVVDVLLERSGGAALARRLTAIAGPKVFTNRERRFSSLCFGNIKVPQSADVSTGEAVLSPREVARAARAAIDVAHARLASGDALLLFGEGTRSRSGALQPMLPGVARYLEGPDSWVLPVGLVGSEDIFPVDGSCIRPGRVVMRAGAPLQAATLLEQSGGDRRQAMDLVGTMIAALLPPAYRGTYASPTRRQS